MTTLMTYAAILFAAGIGLASAIPLTMMLEKRRELRRHRLWIFTTLMANRSAIASVEFVRALNCVEVAFYRNAAVRQRLKLLIQYLSSVGWSREQGMEVPNERTRDLLAQLLVWMAADLDFSFDFADLKDGASLSPLITVDQTEFRTLRQLFNQGYER